LLALFGLTRIRQSASERFGGRNADEIQESLRTDKAASAAAAAHKKEAKD
jgi:hypothetical protein